MRLRPHTVSTMSTSISYPKLKPHLLRVRSSGAPWAVSRFQVVR